jgi:hypothetical protein
MQRFDGWRIITAMPRFYFDVREGVRFDADDEGLEFSDLDTAEREAAEAAAAIGRELLPKGVARSVTVEVRNEHGQRVVTANVTLAWTALTRSRSRPVTTHRADACHI